MRILTSLLLLAGALIIASAARAKEPWEEKLAAEGWVRVTDSKVYADTTWYSAPWVLYVPPDGETIIWRTTVSGAQLTATRVSEEDGKICRKGPWTGGKIRCWIFWMRGSEIREVTPEGMALTIWTMRKGNTEHLQP